VPKILKSCLILRFYKNKIFVPILTYINPSTPSNPILKTSFNIIRRPTPTYGKQFFSFRFPHQNFIRNFYLPLTCHIAPPPPFHSFQSACASPSYCQALFNIWSQSFPYFFVCVICFCNEVLLGTLSPIVELNVEGGGRGGRPRRFPVCRRMKKHYNFTVVLIGQ
jgi:hypothetical protein